MEKDCIVYIDKQLLEEILESGRRLYPRESFLLLRGKKSKNTFIITDLLIPPLAVHGHSFTVAPLHMLPTDFSIIGTSHSHPSGNITPSAQDLNHFFGRILLIVGFPFSDQNIGIYDRNGEKLELQLTENKKDDYE